MLIVRKSFLQTSNIQLKFARPEARFDARYPCTLYSSLVRKRLCKNWDRAGLLYISLSLSVLYSVLQKRRNRTKQKRSIQGLRGALSQNVPPIRQSGRYKRGRAKGPTRVLPSSRAVRRACISRVQRTLLSKGKELANAMPLHGTL